MKKTIKLSLVAALACVGLSTAHAATALEEAIKDVKIDGNLRYRFSSGEWKDGDNYKSIDGHSNITGKQVHNVRVRLGALVQLGYGLNFYGQLQHLSSDRSFPQNSGYNGNNGQTNTSTPFNLRQAYLGYNYEDLELKLGRQGLTTIWDDGMVAMGALASYSGLEGTKLSVFGLDNFENDGDRVFGNNGKGGIGSILGATPANGRVGNTRLKTDAIGNTEASDFLFRQNFLGASMVGSYDLGFASLKPQIWLGYLDNRALFYVLDVRYKMPIIEGLDWGFQFDYLGNSIDSFTKDRFASWDANGQKIKDNLDNGNLINFSGTIEAYGFDAKLGFVTYGKEKVFTINTLEEDGKLGMPGRQIKYLQGSNYTNSFGKNTFAYTNIGYTFNDFRAGIQVVIGGTKTGLGNQDAAKIGGGQKNEYVVDLTYKLGKKLDFLLWYSMLDYNAKDGTASKPDTKGKKNTARFQALYKF
ncbi:hypothetical protein DMB92_02870 [Campylobacter sp. MIT 99-7217]|uniref:major outer membrane protein n=1 Tax=Campylobacter sp. MIT 99-7217 TaxID=535091 RepID=UPI001159B40A|nr:major outer membrane protein [Campylobacter sp. MIT 99-7217]TQR33840.1 hypothetical protein DMB92_02870 [Campylobacter sp. MIT 99-7217]